MMHLALHSSLRLPNRNASLRQRSSGVIVRASVAAPAAEVTRFSLPSEPSLDLEVFRRNGDAAGARPPLVLVHGSYHSAWVYEENWAPYFAARGYDVYSISMRQQGGSTRVPGAKFAGGVRTHAGDLKDFVASLPRPPVVVGHSFGGLIVQAMGLEPGAPKTKGLVLMSSVPPSGNATMIVRFMKRDPFLAFRVTAAFVAKTFATDAKVCRECFFSAALPEADLLRFQKKLAACSPVAYVDVRGLSKEVPLAPAPKDHPPALVLGGTEDKVVDQEAVVELAAYYGTDPVILSGVPHDAMIDVKWEEVAQRVLAFCDKL